MSGSEKPIISTIIPVYNVEKYLDETLKSVVAQDIGFDLNIEVILINDGSTDKSLGICERYAAKYPNVTLIDQKNSGVSVARNKGLEMAKGRYVHFLDSDDVISRNAYSEAFAMLDQCEDIDFAAMKLEFFDNQLGFHPLNYKFNNGNRIVTLDEEPSAIILHMASCLIRRSAIKSQFDKQIQISEDMKFLSDIAVQKRKYGLVDTATYYYRKRRGGGSAIDGARNNITYYTVTPYAVYDQILKDWSDHLYAQNVVMYDLQWRLRQQKQSVLTDSEQNKYMSIIKSLIRRIDDDVILAQRSLGCAHTEYVFSVKYDGKIPDGLKKKIVKKKYQSKPELALYTMLVKDNLLVIEFELKNAANYSDVRVEYSDETFNVDLVENVHVTKSFLSDVYLSHNFFKVSIPLANEQTIKFYLDDSKEPLRLLPRRFSRLQDLYNGYAIFGKYIIKNYQHSILPTSLTFSSHVTAEIKLQIRILCALRLRESIKKLYAVHRSTYKKSLRLSEVVKPVLIPAYTLLKNVKTNFYRSLYYAYQYMRRSKKPIWIVSDLAIAAGDNGEALFRYIMNSSKDDGDFYFAISKNSADYRELKKEYSNVLAFGSFCYKLKFLCAQNIVSAHADETILNIFGERIKHLNDLYRFNFTFLQHGVIHTDISGWLNKYNKNIRIFVTSAQQEYDSILEYPYYYSAENVLLSGLPRYDLLRNDAKGKLILAPTWRHGIAQEIDLESGVRPYSNTFKDSDYFKFYDSFMNDDKLKAALKKYNIKGELYLHPAFQSQSGDFHSNEQFTVKRFPYDYKTAFREGSMLITDYSSVMFDFSYLYKPILYVQFDKDTFYKQHMYTEGYMDDARDGFGPVAYNLSTAVKYTVESIESGCKMEPLYKKRVEDFFTYHDGKNSERVYNAILSLEKG